MNDLVIETYIEEDEAMLDAWLDIQQEEEILLPLHDDIIEFSKSQY